MKILLYAVIGAAGLVALAFGIGAFLPAQKISTHQFTIKAAPDRVYDHMLAVADQPNWRKDVTDVTRLSETRWVEHATHGDITFELVQMERPNSYVMNFESAQGFSGQARGALRAVGDATEVTLTEDVTIANPFFRLLGRVMNFTEKFQKQYEADLRQALEGG